MNLISVFVAFSQMGRFLLSCSVFVLALFFRPFTCQNLNTDGFYISEFLKKMSFSPLESFNFSAPVCSWPKVICDSSGEYVVEFAGSGSSLSGPIPETTIGKLGKLQSLDLSNNKITQLPADFWSLGSLKTLNLSSNLISGPLPNDIGNLGMLQSFDISGNSFSGQIPATISSLSALRVLKLNRNSFEQSIPAGILKLRSIVLIDLSSNNLKGSLPHGFGAAFPELKTLNLAGNEIHGLDSDLSELNSVTSLNISGNFFQGSVMGLFNKNLEVMDLSRNQFRGHISKIESTSNSIWSRLLHLDLSENQLSGKIFQISNQAQDLKHLNLACNRFSRQEFPEIKLLFYLEYLNLSKTRLVHHLPNAISQLTNLKVLDLSWNNLSGRIPSLSVKNLQSLDLSHNNFSGEIPEAILEKLPSMEVFNFSFNNLTFCDSKIPPQTLQSAFFQSTNICPMATNPNFFKRKSHRRHILKLALAIILPIVFIFFVVGSLFFAIHCRRKTRKWVVKGQISLKEDQNISGPFSFNTDSTTWIADVKQASSVPVVIFEKPLFNITFADLLSATTNFDRGTLLAEGKFGPVYRGFLPGGIQVVMKILIHNSTLPDEEAAKELGYLGGIKHPNLVPLTGYCLAGGQRIAIFEYMENGNLQNLLYDLPLGHGIRKIDDWSADNWEEDENGIKTISSEGSLTSWRFRHKIALGTARALAFLHHGCLPPIIHRDVNASSVYLDSNLEPRLSDFGLAKAFGNNSTRPSGYDPPEMSSPGNDFPTQKSDVYCFGVVLLELMTGKKPEGDEYSDEKEGNLVKWVRRQVRENLASEAIDPKIIGTGSEEEMEEGIKIGYLCTAETPLKRPSMQQIVGLLKDIEPSSHPFP